MRNGLIRRLMNNLNFFFKQNSISATTSNVFGSFFNPFEKALGIMQPTDFKDQVEANTSWVYACTSAISESVADVPIRLYAKKGEKVEIVKEHIFYDLWNNVNPYMNNFELRELTEIYQLLCGNCYWYIVKNKLGLPESIWIIPPQFIKIIPDKEKFISGYLYQPDINSEKIAFAPEDIIHFKYPNPNNVYYGLSPLLAAAYEVDINKYMNEYQAKLFNNSAVPEAILSSDQVVQESMAKRMKEEWKRIYSGSDNAGNIAVLSKGLKYIPIQISSRELEFIQSKSITRDSILGIFRVPKSILGLVEDVNRANAEAMEYVFAKRCVSPKLKRFEEKLNEKLLPMYKQDSGTSLYVKFDDPIPINKELESSERVQRLQNGITTINEERKVQGLEPVEWGEVPILPMNMIPFGSEIPADIQVQQSAGKISDQGDQVKGKVNELKLWKLAESTAYKMRLDSQTRLFKGLLVRLFRLQKKSVLNDLHKYYVDGIQKDVGDVFDFVSIEWRKLFAEEGKPHFESAYEDGINNGKRLAKLDTAFNLRNPIAVKYLKEKIYKFSFEVNDTTLNQLKEELSAGLDLGENMASLTDRVEKVFDFAERFRAERIARTELNTTENQALSDTWKDSGVVEGKEWLHGGGGLHPREEHIALSGEQIPMDERFSNGLLQPGDPSEGAGEICNCTCSLLPVLKI